MSWANKYIETLKAGQQVLFRPVGNSMKGKINSGQLCILAPAKKDELKVGDIVLCKVNGNQYLHLIKAIKDDRFCIGNNKGHINGWISFNYVYGKLIKIED